MKYIPPTLAVILALFAPHLLGSYAQQISPSTQIRWPDGCSGPYVPGSGACLGYTPANPAGQTFTGPVNVPLLNKVIKVDQISVCKGGACADASAKVNQCLSDLATAGGGTCDARGFGAGRQTVSEQMHIGATALSTILFDPSTVFEPATYTQKMFNIGPYGQILNLSVSIPSFGANAYSGTVVEINDQLSIPPVTDQTRIVGLNIDASREPNGGVSAGCGLCLIAASGHGIPFVDVRHARITGLKYGIELSATGSGWVNGNHFSDIALSFNEYSLYFIDTSPLPAGIIAGNIFSSLSFEGSAGAAITFAGTGPIQGNIFDPVKIWDTRTPVTNSNSEALENLFIGASDFNITDRNAGTSAFPYQNVYLNTNGNTGVQFSSIQANFGLFTTPLAWPGRAHNFAGMGWNATSGQGEADYYTGVNIGSGQYAHEFWTPNRSSSPTAWSALGGFYNSGNFNAVDGFSSNGTAGYTGTKTAGSCTFTIRGGIITNVTGC